VPLCLPKASGKVTAITVTSLDINLVEWNIYRNSFDFPLSFPKSFQSCMKILSDSICACIPKADSLHELIRNSIVWKRKACVKNWNYIRELNHAMWLIICSGEKRNLQMIASENLKWSINILKSLVLLGIYVNIDIINICLRHPRICINDSKINSATINCPFFKIILFKMFNTPRNIRCFSFLLMFFNLMPRKSYLPKFSLKLLDE